MSLNRMMGVGMYIALNGLGVKIENLAETYDEINIWISVPSKSENVDVHGNEMSGKYLAKRFKDTLTDIGVKNLTVKYKIRDEAWTKEKDKDAQQIAKKELFRSQA